jgi:hypothetical protein
MGMAFFVRTGGVAAVGSHGGEAVATPKIVAPNNCLPFFLFSCRIEVQIELMFRSMPSQSL